MSKLCDTCIYHNNVEQLKPCIIYCDDCELYEKEGKGMDDSISRQSTISEVCTMMFECFGADEEEIDAIETTINNMPSVTQTGRWIPVSERLPEKNVEVLATTIWDAVTIAEMFSANDWFIHEGTTNAETDEIVAWMPLPTPYEPQESEEV